MMVNSTQQNFRVLPNGLIVNHHGLDRDDVRTIMSDSREIPLSANEKMYIDELYDTLVETIDILEVIIGKSKRGDDISEELREANALVDFSKGVVSVDPDMLGRGYIFESKVVNDRKS